MVKYTTKLKDSREYKYKLDTLERALIDVQQYVDYLEEDYNGEKINENASKLVEEMKDILIELRDTTIWEPNEKVED